MPKQHCSCNPATFLMAAQKIGFIGKWKHNYQSQKHANEINHTQTYCNKLIIYFVSISFSPSCPQPDSVLIVPKKKGPKFIHSFINLSYHSATFHCLKSSFLVLLTAPQKKRERGGGNMCYWYQEIKPSVLFMRTHIFHSRMQIFTGFSYAQPTILMKEIHSMAKMTK